MSLCSLSYLGGVLDRASAISCGSDAVTDPVTGRIITPLPHDIAQMITSSHLNCNLSICRHLGVAGVSSSLYSLLSSFVIPSLFVNYFHPWKCGLPSAFTRVLLCPLEMKGTSPHLLRQSQYLLWKLRSDTSDIFGWRMAR
jgi:hypothetical protein